MSKVAIIGNASGTGVFTVASPNSNVDRVLTLPDESGTVDTLQRSGNVLQVVQGRTKTLFTTTSAAYVDIGLSATITPSSASSKILVICNINGIFVNATAGGFVSLILLRDSTNVVGDVAAPYLSYPHLYNSAAVSRSGAQNISYLDSPATTAAVTYKIQTALTGGPTVDFQRDSQVYSTIQLMEIAG